MCQCSCAIGYVTPNDMLQGRQAEIHAERDRNIAQIGVVSLGRERQDIGRLVLAAKIEIQGFQPGIIGQKDREAVPGTVFF